MILTITNHEAENPRLRTEPEVSTANRDGLSRQFQESEKRSRDLVKKMDEDKKVKRRKTVAKARKYLQEFAEDDV